MPKHMRVNLLTHMSLLAASHTSQQATLTKCEAEIAEQRNEIARQRDKIRDQSAKIRRQEAKIVEQSTKLEVQQSQIVHLTAQNEQLKEKCSTLEQHLSSLGETSRQEASQLKKNLEDSEKIIASTIPNPPVLTMTNFQQHKRDGDKWWSPPVYTHHQGYKICLGVSANGHEIKKYVSVFVYFLRGEFDDFLPWPFRGVISFRLLSQVKDKEHKAHSFVYDDKIEDKTCCRVTDEDKGAGRGLAKFIAHTDLDPDFLQNDTLQFQIFSVQCPMLKFMS